MGKLDGKVALVTGSGRNIGRATVLKLAGEGANVVVNARSNREEAESVAAEARKLGVKALPILADVSNKEQVDSMVNMAMSEFGRVDILINNAAIRPHKPFIEVTLQDWEEVRGVVLDGAFYCTDSASSLLLRALTTTLAPSPASFKTWTRPATPTSTGCTPRDKISLKEATMTKRQPVRSLPENPSLELDRKRAKSLRRSPIRRPSLARAISRRCWAPARPGPCNESPES